MGNYPMVLRRIMDIPAGSIPPCKVSSYPCFSTAVAPIGCQRLHQRGIARIITCSRRPAGRMEKLPRRHQKFLRAYRRGSCWAAAMLMYL